MINPISGRENIRLYEGKVPMKNHAKENKTILFLRDLAQINPTEPTAKKIYKRGQKPDVKAVSIVVMGQMLTGKTASETDLKTT